MRDDRREHPVRCWATVVNSDDGSQYVHRKYRTEEAARASVAADRASRDWHTRWVAEQTIVEAVTTDA